MSTINSELWVCVNCRELIETGESTAHAEGAKPLTLLAEGTILLFAGSNRVDEGIKDLDTEDCSGCGSNLAGMRFCYVSA